MPSWTFFGRCRHLVGALAVALAVGCGHTPSSPDASRATDASAVDTSSLDVISTDITTSDITPTDVRTPADTTVIDSGLMDDAGDDGMTDGSCVPPPDTGDDDVGLPLFPDGGPLGGYIRFINLAKGTGTVRFVAASQPGFSPSYIEAVVTEGGESVYIPTQAVSYFINVMSAAGVPPGFATDAGPITVTDASVPTDAGAVSDGGPAYLTAQIIGDVYFLSGCTVVLAGSNALGNIADQTNLELWRLTDIPMRTSQPCVGLVRVIGAVPEGPPLDIDDTDTTPPTPLAHLVQYFEPTGFRVALSGVRHFRVSDDNTGIVLNPDITVDITAGEPHTFYIWGLPPSDGGAGSVEGLLTTDLPPGR